MEKNIAYCGYDCEKCPVHKATKNKDLDFLKQIVITPGITYLEQTLENLGCLGCLDKNTVNFMCSSCLIRNCNINKSINNCGYCEEFPCDKLNNISNETMEILKGINKNK